MCHFHSVIVTGDGRILHLASNSHSDIARHFQLGSGLDAKWWECEWDGKGEIPYSYLIQNRGKDTGPTSLAERAAFAHYEKLVQIVAGDLDPAETAPFDGPEYGDVRAKYKEAMARKNVAPIVAMIEELDFQEDAIREIIAQLGLDIDEIAKERIEELENEKKALEDEKEEEFNRGVEAASEDMYTWEYMQEEIESAVEKAKEAQEELDDETKEECHWEGYEQGFLEAKAGPARAVDFIQGMPSFLFD